MVTNTGILSLTDWTLIGTGLTVCLLQTDENGVEWYVGSVAPDANSVSFPLPAGNAVSIPYLTQLGGGIWVRATEQYRSVTYAKA